MKKTKPDQLLGAHLSTAGGLLKTLARARDLGCTCVQIFAANPRSWQGSPVTVRAARDYLAAAPAHGVRELVIHAIYLVNLASPKPEVVRKSLRALRLDLISAGRLQARCVVVHPGSDLGDGRGEERLLRALHQLAPDIPPNCRLLLEGMAGTRNSLGDLATLGRLCRSLGDRFGVCLDSAHLCATGYHLSRPEGFQQLLRDVRHGPGYRSIGCIHVNDSKTACGSHRDHHANLGEGHVGRPGLRNLLRHAAWRDMPFILETPGFDEQGPDRTNMRRLRLLARPQGAA